MELEKSATPPYLYLYIQFQMYQAASTVLTSERHVLTMHSVTIYVMSYSNSF